MSGESQDIVVKIMIVIVLALSGIVFTLAGYAILLRQENKKYDLIIEEIRSSVLPDLSGGATPLELPPISQGVTEVPRDVQNIPVEQHFFLETFDYRKLILNSFDFLVEGSGFNFVVIEQDVAFKLCVEMGQGKYFITRVNDMYGVMFIGDNPLPGLYESKTAYGIQLVSHTISDGIAPQVIDLRSEGYPACVYKSVTTDGRTFYAAVLGIFPDAAAAREYSNSLDVQSLQRITGWNITDRFPRQLR